MKKQQPAELGGSEETKPAKPTVTPARRVENVEEYYFSVKLKEVARMNESGARVINLRSARRQRGPTRTDTNLT